MSTPGTSNHSDDHVPESFEAYRAYDAFLVENPPLLAANLGMLHVLGVDDYVKRDERFSTTG